MKTKISITRNAMDCLPRLCGPLAGFLISLVLACFALSTTTLAVDPPPDGGYPNQNTAEGKDALFSLTEGFYNTAIGFDTLYSNTGGFFNTATGGDALYFNTTGVRNTAIGVAALYSNTTGSFNTATGNAALSFNTTGADNTATGYTALNSNTTGADNTASGVSALSFNTTGNKNTATGFVALASNGTGNNNTANGVDALANNTTGDNNIALGFRAGSDLTTGDDNIDIGNPGQAGESSTIRIGRVQDQTATFIAGIAGAIVPTGVAVIVNANGHLGTATSSARFKEAIQPIDKASEAILALNPVTFRYKKELDPEGIAQFGLVAEEVEKVNPDLVACDDQGKPYSVRYEAVNAMLLNEFLKEHRTVQELKFIAAKQEATIAEFKKEIDNLIAAMKEQTAHIQKASAELEVSKPAPQMVVDTQ